MNVLQHMLLTVCRFFLYLLRPFLSAYHFVLYHMIDGIQKLAARIRGPSGPAGSHGSSRTIRPRYHDRIDVAAFNSALDAKDRELDRRGKTLEEIQGLLEREREGGRKWKDQCESTRAENQQLRARLSEAEGNAKRSAATLSELQRANAHLEKERRITAAMLETRTSELKEAQAFLTKADDVPDSEVLRAVDALNSKIFQTAASIAEAPQFRYGSEDVDAAEHVARKLERDGWLGPHVLSALCSIDHTNDSVLVQTALQASMTMYVRWLAMSWDQNGAATSNRLKRPAPVPQSVAGRWRAICRESAKVIAGVGDAEHERHAKKLARLAADVLVACRVSDPPEAVYSTIRKAFASPLREIAERTLDFQQISGEIILSCDLIAVVVVPETVFDPVTMDDEWGDPRASPSAGQVLCTTQLGLTREEKKAEGTQKTLLRKPKVVLRSMLEQL